MPLNIAIIGCGLIGRKRAASLAGGRLAICCDVDGGRAQALAAAHPGAEAATDWRAAAALPDIDIVIVATTHDMLAPIAAAAAGAGKHVLIEKPGARRAAELDAVAEAAGRTGALVRIGFSHRYHRAFRNARAIFDSGAAGPLLFIRGRYGHGGRPGYEREWRADPALSGGGELLDQGVHLIDLARWFLGDVRGGSSYIGKFFWTATTCEDNAFLWLSHEDWGRSHLHASWTEWKNLFSFEIFGTTGALKIEGLGGSYGTERLIWHNQEVMGQPPATTIWEFAGPDDSFELEWREFVKDIREDREPSPGILDAQAVLRVVEGVYGK